MSSDLATHAGQSPNVDDRIRQRSRDQESAAGRRAFGGDVTDAPAAGRNASLGLFVDAARAASNDRSQPHAAIQGVTRRGLPAERADGAEAVLDVHRRRSALCRQSAERRGRLTLERTNLGQFALLRLEFLGAGEFLLRPFHLRGDRVEFGQLFRGQIPVFVFRNIENRLLRVGQVG
jgi:hypothetical protein